jgi:hypothetical protein
MFQLQKNLRNNTNEDNPAITAPAVTLNIIRSAQTSHFFDNLNSEGIIGCVPFESVWVLISKFIIRIEHEY